jgi:hypothetical protein
MRVLGQNRKEQPVQDFAARVEGAEFQPTLSGQDLERGPHRGDVPARVSAGVLVAGRKIDAAVGVKIAQ